MVNEQPDYSFIEKEEIEDENKIKHWTYKCKHCKSTILTANTELLAFISQYEQAKVKKQ